MSTTVVVEEIERQKRKTAEELQTVLVEEKVVNIENNDKKIETITAAERNGSDEEKAQPKPELSPPKNSSKRPRKEKSQTISKEEKLRDWEDRIFVNDFCKLKIVKFPDRGSGVIADEDIPADSFVCEYPGRLLTYQDAVCLEQYYRFMSREKVMRCYMFYFQHGAKTMWYRFGNYRNFDVISVDATEYVPKKGPGRFINHSRNGNLQPTKVMVDGAPRLALISKRDIFKGEELYFDYGDRSENALENFPWLKM